MTRFTPQWLQSGSYAASVDRRLIGALWPAPASAGCLVQASTGMVVNVNPGQVAVPTQNSTGATLCSSDASEAVTVTAAPPSGQNRIDLIICRPRGNDLDGGANTDFIFDVVTGTPAASPAVPATPAGTVALAQISVAGGAASIVAGNITDVRPGNLAIAAIPLWIPRGMLLNVQGPSSTLNNPTTVLSGSVNMIAGRSYRVSGSLMVATTAVSTLRFSVNVGAGGTQFPSTALILWNANVTGNGGQTVANGSQVGFGSLLWTASATGAQPVSLVSNGSTGTFSVSAGLAQLTVEDIGGPGAPTT